MDGIHIPQDVADETGVPEDLDSASVGTYRFPDPRRRRIAAVIYVVLALAIVLAIPASPGRWVPAVVSILLAVWHWSAAWPLNVKPEDALASAAVEAPFPIGHASAAVIFHGVRSRPRWHVVLYDAGEPPAKRALVIVDGVSGERIGDPYVEDITSRQ